MHITQHDNNVPLVVKLKKIWSQVKQNKNHSFCCEINRDFISSHHFDQDILLKDTLNSPMHACHDYFSVFGTKA